MSKTVRFLEFLKAQDPETIIYFGTKNGSSYLEIDTARKLIENMDIMEGRLHNRSATKLQNTTNKLLELQEKLVEAREKQDEVDILKEKSNIVDLENAVISATNAKATFEKYLDNWTKLPERKVVTSYPRKAGGTGLCVIVEGIEDGQLWFMKEKDGRNGLIN